MPRMHDAVCRVPCAVCRVPAEVRRGTWSPRTGLTNGSKSPCRCWDGTRILCKSSKCSELLSNHHAEPRVRIFEAEFPMYPRLTSNKATLLLTPSPAVELKERHGRLPDLDLLSDAPPSWKPSSAVALSVPPRGSCGLSLLCALTRETLRACRL